MTAPDKLTVEQCDRDAAATALGYKDWDDACDYRLMGKQERQRDALVQAFARHRQQAEARAEEMVAALGQIAGNNWKDQTRAKHVARNALASYRSARP